MATSDSQNSDMSVSLEQPRIPVGGLGTRSGATSSKIRSAQERFVDILLGTVTPKDWAEIIAMCIIQAKQGDDKARKWLGDYLLGTPVSRVEVDQIGQGGPKFIQVVYSNPTIGGNTTVASLETIDLTPALPEPKA